MKLSVTKFKWWLDQKLIQTFPPAGIEVIPLGVVPLVIVGLLGVLIK